MPSSSVFGGPGWLAYYSNRRQPESFWNLGRPVRGSGDRGTERSPGEGGEGSLPALHGHLPLPGRLGAAESQHPPPRCHPRRKAVVPERAGSSEAGLGWKEFEEGTGLEGSVLCVKDREHPCFLSYSEILPLVRVSRENIRHPAKCGFQMDKT